MSSSSFMYPGASAGTVDQVLVNIGDFVKKGQDCIVIRFDYGQGPPLKATLHSANNGKIVKIVGVGDTLANNSEIAEFDVEPLDVLFPDPQVRSGTCTVSRTSTVGASLAVGDAVIHWTWSEDDREFVVRSPFAGTLVELDVKAGDSLLEGKLLGRIE